MCVPEDLTIISPAVWCQLQEKSLLQDEQADTSLAVLQRTPTEDAQEPRPRPGLCPSIQLHILILSWGWTDFSSESWRRTGVYEKGSVVGRREVWVPSSCKQVTSLRQPDAVYVWTAKKQKVPLRATNTSVATHMPFIHDHDLWVSGAEMTSFLYQGPDDENPFNGTGHDLPLLSGSKQYNTKHMDFSQSLLSQNLIPHSTSLEQILLLSTC